MIYLKKIFLKHSKVPLFLIALFVFVNIIVVASGTGSFAASDATSYEIKNYEVNVEVKKNHNYVVDKKIDVYLPQNREKLLFEIPRGNYRVSQVKVKGIKYKLEKSDSKYYISLNQAEKLKKGKHTFYISYTLQEYMDNNPNYDLFYLNAISSDWEVPIQKLKLTLRLPKDFKWDDLQYYAGQFGTQDVSNKIIHTINNDTVTITGDMIPADFGITFKAELPEGYWVNPLNNEWTINFVLLLFLMTAIVVIVFWIVGGRDPKFKKKRLPKPIEGISTADAAYIFNGYLSIRDLVPLIIRLGIGGSLKIVEYSPKKYRIFKLSSPAIDEDRYIRGIYTSLFEDTYEGRAIEMEDIGRHLHRILHDVEASVASRYSTKNMRAKTALSSILRILSIIFASVVTALVPILTQMYLYEEKIRIGRPLGILIISIILLVLITHRFDLRYDMDQKQYKTSMLLYTFLYAALLGYVGFLVYLCSKSIVVPILLIVLGLFMMIMICLMTARARENARLANRILGMRNFIDSSEIPELISLQNEDSEYFYHMLPYAMQFSQIEQWASKFKHIKIEPPAWFESEVEGHSVHNNVEAEDIESIARAVHQFERTMESEYNAMTRRQRIFLRTYRR